MPLVEKCVIRTSDVRATKLIVYTATALMLLKGSGTISWQVVGLLQCVSKKRTAKINMT